MQTNIQVSKQNFMIPTNLDDYNTEEGQVFMNDVGTLVFQSALMKYLALEEEDKLREFETYINLQVGAENFVEELYANYPKFGEILIGEMTAFKSEMEEFSK